MGGSLAANPTTGIFTVEGDQENGYQLLLDGQPCGPASPAEIQMWSRIQGHESDAQLKKYRGPLDVRFHWGKYCGTTLYDVKRVNPDYVVWARDWLSGHQTLTTRNQGLLDALRAITK